MLSKFSQSFYFYNCSLNNNHQQFYKQQGFKFRSVKYRIKSLPKYQQNKENQDRNHKIKTVNWKRSSSEVKLIDNKIKNMIQSELPKIKNVQSSQSIKLQNNILVLPSKQFKKKSGFLKLNFKTSLQTQYREYDHKKSQSNQDCLFPHNENDQIQLQKKKAKSLMGLVNLNIQKTKAQKKYVFDPIRDPIKQIQKQLNKIRWDIKKQKENKIQIQKQIKNILLNQQIIIQNFQKDFSSYLNQLKSLFVKEKALRAGFINNIGNDVKQTQEFLARFKNQVYKTVQSYDNLQEKIFGANSNSDLYSEIIERDYQIAQIVYQ